jgi:hypothetical protein
MVVTFNLIQKMFVDIDNILAVTFNASLGHSDICKDTSNNARIRKYFNGSEI